MKAMPRHDRKTAALVDIIQLRWTPRRVLVVGCGTGEEAAVLAHQLGAAVIGVDIRNRFHPEALKVADLRIGDATRLAFDDGTFDFVYSFHALEHIPNYSIAIAEMARVLRPGGGCCVGTPNRSRLIGYLGSSRASALQKLARNVRDWKAMARGRFRNEYGAHAGFTAQELHTALATHFTDLTDISAAYYASVYRRQWLLAPLQFFGLAKFLQPAVYFTGIRR